MYFRQYQKIVVLNERFFIGVKFLNRLQNDSKQRRSFFIIFICAKCADNIGVKNF